MNKHIKRALSLTAVAPLAVIAMAGSAGAATSFAEINQVGNVITGTCQHPDFTAPDELAVQVRIYLEGNGTGSDRNDVERIKVTATDNQGIGSWDDNDVRVQKIRARYFAEDDVNTFIDGFPKPLYASTSDSSSTRTGGIKRFGHEADNVGIVEAKVTWRVAGDTETLICSVPLGNQFPI